MKKFISSCVDAKKSTSRNFFIHLLRAFTSRDDLQVWQKKDHRGHYYWQAYEPMTERKISFGSEAEMRVWIEQRYYK